MILNLIKKFIKHELIKGSFYVFLGATANNFLSFLFNLFLVRTFSTSDYGIYASLISIITLFSFLGQSITTIFIKFAGDLLSSNKIDEASFLYKKFLLFIFAFSALICFVFFIFSNLILDFLHIDNLYYLVLAILIIFVTYMSIINEAFLRSSLKFKFLAFSNSLGSFLKLGFGFLIVTAGFGIAGALIAIFLNTIVPFLLGFLPLLFLLKNKSKDQVLPIRKMLTYIIPAGVAVLSATSFITTDIILVKHFFDPSSAGLYGGLSLIGKVIFYFTFPIPVVMFPLIVKRYNVGVQFHKLFYFSLLLVLIPSSFIIMFYYLFPEFVVSLFLGGDKYFSIIPFVGLFGIFIALYSLVNVCINFFLSIGRAEIYKIVLPMAFLQIVLILSFHKDFYQVVYASILSLGLLLLVLLIYYYQKFYGVYHVKK